MKTIINSESYITLIMEKMEELQINETLNVAFLYDIYSFIYEKSMRNGFDIFIKLDYEDACYDNGDCFVLDENSDSVTINKSKKLADLKNKFCNEIPLEVINFLNVTLLEYFKIYLNAKRDASCRKK